MFYGVVTRDGQLHYCNAGQEPPLLLKADSEAWLETGGPVIGLLPIASYDYGTTALAPGDLVIVCSDGVTEARNVANDEFGQQRMLDALRGLRGQRPEVVLEQLVSAVKEFSRNAPQADDITILVCRYRGPS
jgi:sigma-B regulation protein RsbU (phosphoserine phosphatase)